MSLRISRFDNYNSYQRSASNSLTRYDESSYAFERNLSDEKLHIDESSTSYLNRDFEDLKIEIDRRFPSLYSDRYFFNWSYPWYWIRYGWWRTNNDAISGLKRTRSFERSVETPSYSRKVKEFEYHSFSSNRSPPKTVTTIEVNDSSLKRSRSQSLRRESSVERKAVSSNQNSTTKRCWFNEAKNVEISESKPKKTEIINFSARTPAPAPLPMPPVVFYEPPSDFKFSHKSASVNENEIKEQIRSRARDIQRRFNERIAEFDKRAFESELRSHPIVLRNIYLRGF